VRDLHSFSEIPSALERLAVDSCTEGGKGKGGRCKKREARRKSKVREK
jgi:hypothetical protein